MHILSSFDAFERVFILWSCPCDSFLSSHLSVKLFYVWCFILFPLCVVFNGIVNFFLILICLILNCCIVRFCHDIVCIYFSVLLFFVFVAYLYVTTRLCYFHFEYFAFFNTVFSFWSKCRGYVFLGSFVFLYVPLVGLQTSF